MIKIKSLKAKEILDSNHNPALEVELETDLGKVKASVPSGTSKGKYEALELRDEDKKGISKAIEKIEKVIEPALKNKEIKNQNILDEILLNLDGTKNKSHLGANSILAVSIAGCRANALALKTPLYQYLNQIYSSLKKKFFLFALPKPSFNLIEGGSHFLFEKPEQLKNILAFQEFMIIPNKTTFKENLEIGIKIYQNLKKILEEKFKKEYICLTRESAFSISLKSQLFRKWTQLKKISEIFNLILESAKKNGLEKEIKFALDIAASEFYQNGKYKLGEKYLSREKLIEIYQDLTKKYPILSIEDPFSEEDFDGFRKLKNKIGKKVIIFGDDLTVSNIERIKLAQKNRACNGLILKPNQIGTVTETLKAAKLAKSFGWKIMVANRAGETEDDFIADLAVGIGAEFIKSGAPFAKERMAKYKRLLKIEEEINSQKRNY